MANYRDIERVCKKYKVKISRWSLNDNSVLMALKDTLFISQDRIDADYNDDNLFEMLVTAGEYIITNAYGDDLLIASVNWAIERAKELGLKMSRERQNRGSKKAERFNLNLIHCHRALMVYKLSAARSDLMSAGGLDG